MATGKSRHLCIAEKLGLSSIEASARLSQHRSQRRVVSMILDWVPLMIVSNLMEARHQVSLKQRGLPFESRSQHQHTSFLFSLYMKDVRDVFLAKRIRVLSSQFRPLELPG